MANKRPRNRFEDDLRATESPFVFYGTPLPPLDSEARDDGSYVPIWKQEVTDERGRKRLHGAFTGGFSAGYFNTVGSKDGWTPSNFVSSRANRRKDDTKFAQQRPEDFMDEEDLVEAAQSQKLETNQSFAGFGATADDDKRRGLLMDLFSPTGETMGVKLLRKMGWRDGQGIGPKQRRNARLGDAKDLDMSDQEQHLFAPKDTQMILFSKKDDRMGLGFESEARLNDQLSTSAADTETINDNDDSRMVFSTGVKHQSKSAVKQKGSGLGIGVLNDTGSDDENPFELGPKISYNPVIGGDKKNKKAKARKHQPSAPAANPLLGSRPVFRSKKVTSTAFRKCHDGRLPIDGFVLAESLDSTALDMEERFPRPKAPEGWKSSRAPTITQPKNDSTYQSTADAAKGSKLDSKSRAQMLGEDQLPGKSVFDYLSSAARDRIAAATGRSDLPHASDEAVSIVNKREMELSNAARETKRQNVNEAALPYLAKDIALAALGRGTAGWTPYASDPDKSTRYRNFLEFRAGLCETPPPRPQDLKADDWKTELDEFAHAAEVFKPMTGLMASRFTSSTNAPKAGSGANESDHLLRKPQDDDCKPKDPAEEAAKLGMFGPMTRIVKTFYPTRLVCKRFGIKPPEHVVNEPSAQTGISHNPTTGQSASASTSGNTRSTSYGSGAFSEVRANKAPDLVGKQDMDKMMQESGRSFTDHSASRKASDTLDESMDTANPRGETPVIDTEKNDALEGKRAGEELFKAIFADDSD